MAGRRHGKGGEVVVALTQEQAERIGKAFSAAGYTEVEVNERMEKLERIVEVGTGEWDIFVTLDGMTVAPTAAEVEGTVHDMRIDGVRVERVYSPSGDGGIVAVVVS